MIFDNNYNNSKKNDENGVTNYCELCGTFHKDTLD